MFGHTLRLGSSTHVWLSGQSLVADVTTGFCNLVQAQDWAGLAEFVWTGDDTIPGTANADDLLGGQRQAADRFALGSDVLAGLVLAASPASEEDRDVLDGVNLNEDQHSSE